MKQFYLLVVLVMFSNLACAQLSNDTLFVAHWNLENLFDTYDDPKTEDEEFLPGSEKQWTAERLEKKMYNLSRVIRSMNNDNGPDLMGVCEVEHQFLLDSMVNNYLSDKTLKVAYLESPDGRGIDNGILYNYKLLDLISVNGYRVNLNDGTNTRLILGGEFKTNNNDTIYFFVNHWPSRRSGADATEGKRVLAAEILRHEVDSLVSMNPKSKIIIVGDFNDEPTNISITKSLKAKPFFCDSVSTSGLIEDKKTDLFNTAYKAWFDGAGSFFYQQDFNMLDQIIISKELLIGENIKYVCNSFEVYKPEMIVTRTGKYQGAPFPTYGGSRYLGGYSDHFPVTAKFVFSK